MVREVVGALIDCPRCKNGCKYCHGHGIIVAAYKTPILVDDEPPKKRSTSKRKKRVR